MIRQLLLAAVLLLQLYPATAQDKFCHLAGRDFSRSEIAFITSMPGVDSVKLKQGAQAAFPALASIVLCERSGVKLSPAAARKNLENSLLLMKDDERRSFEQMLKKRSWSAMEWLDKEAEKFTSQLNDAVRRWYLKNYAAKDEIKFEHIQAWYYRHGDIFRRLRVNPEKLWCFTRNNDGEKKFHQALAALKQGMLPADVRKEFALLLNDDVLFAELHGHLAQRQSIDEKYVRIQGDKYIFLLQHDAVEYAYVELDEKLEYAIRNALQEALAKGRLSETLKKEFAQQKLIFY